MTDILSKHEEQIRIGGKAQVTLETNETLEGEIFAFDRGTKVLVLRQDGASAAETNFRIINTNSVSGIQCTPPEEEAVGELPVIDIQRSRARENRAVQTARADALKIGVFVTKEGQQLFDALSRTLPCQWQDKTIVVLGEVSISEPYGQENITTTHPDDVVAMERVKKVLIAQRATIFGGADGEVASET